MGFRRGQGFGERNLSAREGFRRAVQWTALPNSAGLNPFRCMRWKNYLRHCSLLLYHRWNQDCLFRYLVGPFLIDFRFP